MGKDIPFPEAVKAAKFLMFAATMQTINKGQLDPLSAIYVINAANEKYLTPEWRVEGKALGKLLLYEGTILVFGGPAQDFMSSTIWQTYYKLIYETWEAEEMIEEMRSAIVKLITPPVPTLDELHRGVSIPQAYKGDYKNTVVYEIWKNYMPKQSVWGRMFRRL